MTIRSRIPVAEYTAIDALNITRLKEIGRSPQHYQYALTHPKETPALTLGIATHVAVLEPERFTSQFAIWDRRTDSGRMAPRNGKWWDAFQAENAGKTILTEDEATEAVAIATAVRTNQLARGYLVAGEPEVTMEWTLPEPNFDRLRKCKGRVDWLTPDHTLVGLKTTRDCRPMLFGTQAARLGYHMQFAWYRDGYELITHRKARMVEIVVENTPPYAVAVYNIPEDVIEQGRDDYRALLETLHHCEQLNTWPGPVDREQDLTLPSWAFPGDDDIADLGLEVA